MSSGSSRIAGDRPVPHIVTELPGPKARAHVEFDETWTSPSLPRAYPIVPVRGDGLTVEDIDGNLFLDFAAGHRGQLRPATPTRRSSRRSRSRPPSSSTSPRPTSTCRSIPRSAASWRGSPRSPGASGCTWATRARRSSRRRSSSPGYATKRPYLVAFLGAFHGRTYGSVSLTASKAKYHAGFGPLLPGIFHAPYGRVEDLRWFDEVLFDKLAPASEVAAIIVEPIQGEGGYVVPEDGFLEGLRRICDEHGILLIADEIQSGAGRTGRMWAVEHWGVEPDILLTAKGIASGMPLGAMVARAELLESWGPGTHGSTYGGNPVACAAALATIELLEGGLVDNAAARGEQALGRPATAATRFPGSSPTCAGRASCSGSSSTRQSTPKRSSGRHSRTACWCSSAARRSVRMSPPLTVSEAEMATGLRIFGESVAAVAGEHGEILESVVAARCAARGRGGRLTGSPTPGEGGVADLERPPEGMVRRRRRGERLHRGGTVQPLLTPGSGSEVTWRSLPHIYTRCLVFICGSVLP